jgi:hypothetical protein
MLLGAQNSFDRCIVLEPSNRAGYMGRARVEYYREDFAAAEVWARKAVDCGNRRDFEDFDALYLVMECSVLQAKVDVALKVVDEIRRIVPDQAEVRDFAAERLARVGLQLMNAKVFGAAVSVLQACSAIAPQHEGISNLVRVNLLAAQAHQELERLQNDSAIPKPVWGLGLLAVGMYTGEFESEHAKDQFKQNVFSALGEIPPHVIRDALQRIQQRYPNIWQCNDKYLGEVLRIVSEGARSQLAAKKEQGCFSADTPVITPRGRVPICNLRQGDVVLGFEPATGAVWGTVEALRCVRRPLMSIRTDLGTVRVTSGHLFLSVARGRVAAGSLYVGETVSAVDASGDVVLVTIQEVLPASTSSEMAYNVYLDSTSNFVAGSLCVCSYGFLPGLRDALRRLRYTWRSLLFGASAPCYKLT